MAELPLSKFAPFTKEEARYQYEVANKLREVNVRCQGCMYLGEKVDRESTLQSDIYLYYDEEELYDCTILSELNDLVALNSFCRFFTPKEDSMMMEDSMMTNDSRGS